MPRWTSEQQLAIDKEGTNVIVSAGAGSGKTAVLTERVLRKLRGGVSITNLLILTFTKAAASEMKDRIRNGIKSDPSIIHELNKVDGAYITTFDSYALSIVKKYHYLLNVSKNISIGESSVFTLKTSEILNEVITDLYASHNEQFESLISDFCVKDDNVIRTSILKMNSKLDLRYDKNEYLNNYLETFYSLKNLNKLVDDYYQIIDKKREELESLLEELGNTLDEASYQKQYDYYNGLAYSKNYNDIVKYLPVGRSPMLPKDSEEAKEIKTRISELVKEIKNMAKYDSIEDIKTSLLKTKNYVSIIIDIIKEVDKRLLLFKNESDTYEFIDISKMAIKVLEDFPYIKEELKANYNEIMVDEYQDTNDLQEMFINMISKNNVYMVGDIKQSIYRFRNANPYIFKSKYDKYSKLDNGFKIDLNKNFRSRREVLENINLIFDLIMDDYVGGADYKESHQMIFGNTSYEETGNTNQNNNLEVYNYSFDKELGFTKEEIEAFIIANDIKEKINNKYLTFNPKEKNGVPHPVTYNDFVIMIDRSTNFNLYKKIFTYMHIPLSVKKDESIKNNTDLNLLKNIIVLITKINKNSFDTEFKESYVSIARSYLFKYLDDDIFNIVRNNSYTETSIYEISSSIANICNDISNRNLLDLIIEKFDYYKKLITIGNIEEAINRLDYLKGIGDSLNGLGYSLLDFKDYLISLVNDDELDLKYHVLDDATNSVKLMTIHASKGLEFPICYFSGLYAPFNLGDIKERFLYDPYIGIITPYFMEGIDDTILKPILKEHYTLEEISEKDRLFYVAVTRAKEKMIMILPRLENDKLPTLNLNTKLKYRSFKDMLLSINDTLAPYSKEIDLSKIPLSKNYNISKNIDYDVLKQIDPFKEQIITFNKELIDEGHFSRVNNSIMTKESINNMKFGTHIHEVFESIDLLNPDLSLLSKFDKEKVTTFLNSDIILLRPKKVYQEYEFITVLDEKNMHGIIDLLLEYDDHFTIIDYKLKQTSDDAYKKQINGYKEYIKNKTGKEVLAYLYSVTLNEFIEIR